jgi:hypothetical protein
MIVKAVCAYECIRVSKKYNRNPGNLKFLITFPGGEVLENKD